MNKESILAAVIELGSYGGFIRTASGAHMIFDNISDASFENDTLIIICKTKERLPYEHLQSNVITKYYIDAHWISDIEINKHKEE